MSLSSTKPRLGGGRESDSDLTDQPAVEPSAAGLQRLCDQRAAALVLPGATLAAVQARMHRLDLAAGHLCLELVDTFDPSTLSALSMCSVSVAAGSTMFVFASGFVKHVERTQTELPLLVLKVPEEIAGAECRRTFRIPVVAQIGLKTQLWYGAPKRRLPCRTVDISVTGAQIELERDSAIRLKPGQMTELRLRFGERAVDVRAEVRWEYCGRHGLLFPDSFDGDVVKAPGELWSIVREVESLWMRSNSPGAS